MLTRVSMVNHWETEGPWADANIGSRVEMYEASTVHVSDCSCIKTMPLCFKKPKSPERGEILYGDTSENYKTTTSKGKN